MIRQYFKLTVNGGIPISRLIEGLSGELYLELEGNRVIQKRYKCENPGVLNEEYFLELKLDSIESLEKISKEEFSKAKPLDNLR